MRTWINARKYREENVRKSRFTGSYTFFALNDIMFVWVFCTLIVDHLSGRFIATKLSTIRCREHNWKQRGSSFNTSWFIKISVTVRGASAHAVTANTLQWITLKSSENKWSQNEEIIKNVSLFYFWLSFIYLLLNIFTWISLYENTSKEF